MKKLDIPKLRRSSKLRKIFKDFEVKLAYVYGSQLKPKYVHKESDIDIGILFKKTVPESEYFDRRLRIMDPLSKFFKIEADAVVLQQVPLLLRYVATCEGRYLYEEKKSDHVDYDVKIMREFADFLPFLEALNKEYVES